MFAFLMGQTNSKPAVNSNAAKALPTPRPLQSQPQTQTQPPTQTQTQPYKGVVQAQTASHQSNGGIADHFPSMAPQDQFQGTNQNFQPDTTFQEFQNYYAQSQRVLKEKADDAQRSEKAQLEMDFKRKEMNYAQQKTKIEQELKQYYASYQEQVRLVDQKYDEIRRNLNVGPRKGSEYSHSQTPVLHSQPPVLHAQAPQHYANAYPQTMSPTDSYSAEEPLMQSENDHLPIQQPKTYVTPKPSKYDPVFLHWCSTQLGISEYDLHRIPVAEICTMAADFGLILTEKVLREISLTFRDQYRAPLLSLYNKGYELQEAKMRQAAAIQKQQRIEKERERERERESDRRQERVRGRQFEVDREHEMETERDPEDIKEELEEIPFPDMKVPTSSGMPKDVSRAKEKDPLVRQQADVSNANLVASIVSRQITEEDKEFKTEHHDHSHRSSRHSHRRERPDDRHGDREKQREKEKEKEKEREREREREKEKEKERHKERDRRDPHEKDRNRRSR
jgi:hypothetical protein